MKKKTINKKFRSFKNSYFTWFAEMLFFVNLKSNQKKKNT